MGGGVEVGTARRPWTAATTAVSWPETNVSGAGTVVIDNRSLRWARAGRIALARRGSGAYTYAFLDPTARAASTRPSSTRCGARVSSARSLLLAGSAPPPVGPTPGGGGGPPRG